MKETQKTRPNVDIVVYRRYEPLDWYADFTDQIVKLRHFKKTLESFLFPVKELPF